MNVIKAVSYLFLASVVAMAIFFGVYIIAEGLVDLMKEAT